MKSSVWPKFQHLCSWSNSFNNGLHSEDPALFLKKETLSFAVLHQSLLYVSWEKPTGCSFHQKAQMAASTLQSAAQLGQTWSGGIKTPNATSLCNTICTTVVSVTDASQPLLARKQISQTLILNFQFSVWKKVIQTEKSGLFGVT